MNGQNIKRSLEITGAHHVLSGSDVELSVDGDNTEATEAGPAAAPSMTVTMMPKHWTRCQSTSFSARKSTKTPHVSEM